MSDVVDLPAEDVKAELVAAKAKAAQLERRWEADQKKIFEIESSLEAEKQARESDHAYHATVVSSFEKNVSELSAELSSTHEELESKKQSLQEQSKKLSMSEQLAEEQQNQLESLRSELLQVYADADKKKEERKLLEAAKSKLDADFHELELSLAGEKAKRELVLSQLEVQASAALDERTRLQADLSQSSKEKAHLQIELADREVRISNLRKKRVFRTARGQFVTLNALPEDMEFVESRRPWTVEKFADGIYFVRSPSENEAMDILHNMGYD